MNGYEELNEFFKELLIKIEEHCKIANVIVESGLESKVKDELISKILLDLDDLTDNWLRIELDKLLEG